MSPTTFEALAILIVAFVPGAGYVWAFERQAGPYGVTFADRTMRFLAASIVVHLVFGWLEYVAWRVSLQRVDGLNVGQFAILWGTTAVVLSVPAAIGWMLGSLYATRNAQRANDTLRRASKSSRTHEHSWR